MKSITRKAGRKQERGMALFIAIFTLLLISVVALALMTMAGTESSLNSNYKSSVQAFYNAKAGVEEGRGRLWSGNPNSVVALLGSPMPLGKVVYILNPAGAEVVSPTTMSNAYADTEYIREWGVNPPTATTTTTASVSTQAGVPGPLYKWVRITPVTENSLGIDVNGDGALDNANPLYYDGTQQFRGDQVPAGSNPYQVFEVTALAVTPSGSQRMVQYVTSANSLNLTFPSALTFDGPAPVYNAPHSNPFSTNGNDRSGSNGLAGCTVPAQPAKPAIGVVSTPDISTVQSGIPSNRLDHYVGAGGTPSVANVSSVLPSNEQSVSSLNSLVQTITQSANNVLTGPVSGLTAAQLGSATSPQITVVNGDLSISGNNTGYGLLVVTGTLSFSGSNGWRGVVLVIGQGNLQVSGGGNNEFDGAILVAKTLDAAGNPLASLGTPTVGWNGGGGNGIYYDSCWINNSASIQNYKVLSFREVSQ
jgi:Tfp pilus assembly protein PilX